MNFVGVHHTHIMEIENGSTFGGVTRGTFRCKRCKKRAVWPRGAALTIDQRLAAPCVAGEVVNQHVIEHVPEPQPDFDELNRVLSENER
jgi:hypothetical protein